MRVQALHRAGEAFRQDAAHRTWTSEMGVRCGCALGQEREADAGAAARGMEGAAVRNPITVKKVRKGKLFSKKGLALRAKYGIMLIVNRG